MRARIPSVRPRTSRPRSEASGEECLWGTKTLLRHAAMASYSWIRPPGHLVCGSQAHRLVRPGRARSGSVTCKWNRG
jgi:hypothetical protein